jgi:hypothetical protein
MGIGPAAARCGAGGRRAVSKRKHDKPRRVDYWHDPDAPKPTSRKPSASVIVRYLLFVVRPPAWPASGIPDR